MSGGRSRREGRATEFPASASTATNSSRFTRSRDGRPSGPGCWSESQHEALLGELQALVETSWQEALTYGSMTDGPWLDKNELFEDVFKDMPAHLIAQREQLRGLSD